MARYGNLGTVARPRGGVMAIGKVGPRQAHGYRNCYGMMSSRLSGYAGMLGAAPGHVTLAKIKPAAAYGGGKAPMPSKNGGGGRFNIDPEQVGQWLNFGIDTAGQLGIRVPGQAGPSSSMYDLPPVGAGPRTGGTSMTRPPVAAPKKSMSPWTIAAIVGGVALVAGAGAYTLT